MAVVVDNPKNPKALPDMPKISGMGEPILNAVKKLRSGSREVVTGLEMKSIEQIQGLYERLRATSGPGIYYFEVFDQAGNEKDHWTVQIGADEGESFNDMAAPMPGAIPPNGIPAGAAPGIPMNLGNGFYLTLSPGDPTKGWLTTPQRQVLPWKEGMDLPVSASSFPSSNAPSSPIPSQGGWGSYPAVGGPDDRTKMLEEQLRAERERNREEEHRRELQAVESKFERLIESQNKRHEELLRELTAKKTDPELESVKETNRILQQQLQEEKREREAQRREEQLKSEIKATNDRMEKILSEMGNKNDPMITMLGQMMTAQQQATQAMMQAMENTSRQNSEANREHSRIMAERFSDAMMKPDRLYELIRMAKDRGPEQALHKEMSEAMRGVFGMMQDVVRMQAELSPGEPTWMSALRQGMDQIGTLGSAYFNRKAEADSEREQHERIMRARQVAQRRRQLAAASDAEPVPAAAEAPAPVAPAAKPVAKVPQTPDEIREAAAAAVFPDAPVEEDAPDSVVETPPKEDDFAADMPTELPPGVSPEEAAERLKNASADEVRELIEPVSDQDFFGIIYSRIGELRSAVAANRMSPEEVVDAVLQAIVALHSFKQPPPPALELVHSGHYDVMVERLLPEAADLFRAQVSGQLAEKVAEAAA